jgi:hypothetical protein
MNHETLWFCSRPKPGNCHPLRKDRRFMVGHSISLHPAFVRSRACFIVSLKVYLHLSLCISFPFTFRGGPGNIVMKMPCLLSCDEWISLFNGLRFVDRNGLNDECQICSGPGILLAFENLLFVPPYRACAVPVRDSFYFSGKTIKIEVSQLYSIKQKGGYKDFYSSGYNITSMTQGLAEPSRRAHVGKVWSANHGSRCPALAANSAFSGG